MNQYFFTPQIIRIFVCTVEVDDQKIALFTHIEKNSKRDCITWKKIAQALDGIDLGDLALSIREKYCHGVG